MRFLTHQDLAAKGIKYSKDQIRRLQRLPPDDPKKFPDAVKGLGREDNFTEPEIDKYIERRMEDRGEA